MVLYLPKYIIRRDRGAVVVEDGDEFGGVGAELDHHQARLRMPELLVTNVFSMSAGSSRR